MSQSFTPEPGMQGDLIEGNVGGPETAEAAREEEAQSRAVVLEMIGDLPEADSKPPSNMLFVCKLNPVTGEEVCCSQHGQA